MPSKKADQVINCICTTNVHNNVSSTIVCVFNTCTCMTLLLLYHLLTNTIPS